MDHTTLTNTYFRLHVHNKLCWCLFNCSLEKKPKCHWRTNTFWGLPHLVFFLNWSFAARIYPPLPTVVSAWEYKKRYSVEGWGGQRNSSKISSFTSQYYTCIYCSFVYRENFPSHFKFKEYCPLVFRQLRDRFGIDDSEYAVSGDAACVTCMFIYLLHYST